MHTSGIPNLPSEGFLRAHQIHGCKRRGLLPIIPISRSAFWKKVAAGDFPPGLLISSRTRVWPVEDVRDFIEDMKAGTR